ncbi:MAG: hypothetical protein CMG66_04110 [Candidatus Marinimicrobia bacterium]|nr:hypothetical protein [Candidatus Neomarinimicrobiota bacterium]|tara:strand:- start:250 stop:444 length:195 start_codon:yes stop_codon:yes gene_type:complete
MVDQKILPWVIDNTYYNIWEQFGIQNRDLIFLDKNGNLHERINLTDSFNQEIIIDLINQSLIHN